MFLLSLLLLLLCDNVVVLVVHLSLCIHNYRWTTTKLPSNNKNNNNKQINLHKLCNLFVVMSIVVTVMLLLFLFSCNCCSTITDAQQEQEQWCWQQQQQQQQQKRSLYINSWMFKSSYLMSRSFTIAWYRMSSWCITDLDHRMSVMGGTSDCKLPSQLHSKHENVKLTLCSTVLGHQMWVVHTEFHCILNCILQNVKMTLCSTALGHQMPLLGGTSDCPLHSQLHSSECQADLV